MPAELPPAPPAGFVLFDKPAGVSSHTALARVRREHGLRGGHAGTLDPFATGLLVLLLGQATRLQRYVLGQPKTYVTTAKLGWRSTTGDPEGELEHTGAVPEVLELPTGRIKQRVPLTSAVRVDGERLYKKAHRGENAERPVREVEIYRAELLDRDDDRARFEIRCSAGTYIRTLIEELGDAYCLELRRTEVGSLRLADAGPELLPASRLVEGLPARELSGSEARDVVHGRQIDPAGIEPDEPVRLVVGGRLLAIARLGADGVKTEVVLA